MLALPTNIIHIWQGQRCNGHPKFKFCQNSPPIAGDFFRFGGVGLFPSNETQTSMSLEQPPFQWAGIDARQFGMILSSYIIILTVQWWIFIIIIIKGQYLYIPTPVIVKSKIAKILLRILLELSVWIRSYRFIVRIAQCIWIANGENFNEMNLWDIHLSDADLRICKDPEWKDQDH